MAHNLHLSIHYIDLQTYTGHLSDASLILGGLAKGLVYLIGLSREKMFCRSRKPVPHSLNQITCLYTPKISEPK